jgi:hypothetical protein
MMVEQIIQSRLHEATGAVMAGMRPLATTFGEANIVFLRRPRGRFRRARQVALYVIEEMMDDHETEKKV